jgi:NAD(P)-dependent dehydrogenase (short-subunit alcohol dehydrogenase family)
MERPEMLTHMCSKARTVRFSEEDLMLFSRASGDRNPLHLSADYARSTSYGQRVVFGALGAIACLGEITVVSGDITQLTADFLRPMFLETDYALDARDQGDARLVRLLDGSIPVLALRIELASQPGQLQKATVEIDAAHFERSEPRAVDGEVEPGLEVSGDYACDPAALELLRERWKISVDPFVVEILLWSSYFVGMELPGKSALFFRLTASVKNSPRAVVYLRHSVKVGGFDRALGQMRAGFLVQVESRSVASGEYRAFVRPVLKESSEEVPVGTGLAGKTVLLVGSSRGLGATLRRVLQAQGAKVVGISRAPEASSKDLLSGDASDPAVLAKVREHIVSEYGHLDFLICNACPSILPLRLEPATLQRIDSYISRALSLVLQPISAFIDLLEATGGCNVVISSRAVESPVREWPHYVAAKNAAEGLAQVAVMQFPKTSLLIVRPQKLLTEMTNTPMGRRGATSPMSFALRISERLQRPLQAGTVEIFR